MYALLPGLDEERQKKLDTISASIDDCLEIIKVEEDNRIDQAKELAEELKTSEERVEELENIEPDTLELGGGEVVDGWIMNALYALLEKGRPHETLKLLESLANPRVTAEYQRAIEMEELLY